MKKFLIVIFMTGILLISLPESLLLAVNPAESDNNYDVTMKRDLLCLMLAYPESAVNIEKDRDGQIYLLMKSGRKILYDDKRPKNFESKLSNPDLQDVMEQIYPLRDINQIMPKDMSPGRIRSYPLLQEVYGASQGQVQSHLVSVNTLGGGMMFNSCNKGAESLQRTVKELVVLSRVNKKVAAALYPLSGTFNYRCIAGTSRLSPHAFGIAIDLARDKRDYWKWATKEQGESRIQSYPREVVQCFEKNNFIWGGKWEQFDILHFEYRPEIILKARYFSNLPEKGDAWYKGVPDGDDNIKKCIEIIEKGLSI